ncbi:MAG: mannosyltransferase family protein [Nostoc sp. ChiSLP02]|nr:mannosyltransferase family protein [Nostoc sp. DedSLP05]MDZ8099463.1 mannosyltransferase family protein [Nostoc sp. DedSLP01]MDZ8184537.1 mannosyltransferase family protein [Nostoc sp. ChiSLP02]
MAKVQIAIRKILWKTDFLYPAAIWLASRIFIWIAMLLVAPKLPLPADAFVPRFGWEVFDAWDSMHYRAIVTSGYEFVDDGKQHNLAFFPLFPLSIWVLMKLGLPFELAGILVNNLAFFAALYCLYFWVREHYGNSAAQWVSAVVCCFPSSMFTAVIYTEGLYLFLSTAALRAFDRQEYHWTALWGAMATATRPTGMAMIPALAIAAWKERRPRIAYIAAFATAIGVLLFSLYCAIYFRNPLAFIQAQRGWRPSFGFDWQGWLNMLMQVVVGSKNWEFGWVQNPSGGIQDPWYPSLVTVIVGSSYLLWRFHKHPIARKLVYGFYALVVFLFVLASEQWMNNLLNLFMVLGGGFALWRLRRQLTPVTVIYGFCGIGLLLASGGTISLSRLAYGIVPLNIAIGVLLSRNPRQGYFILGLFVTLLAKIAVGFAQEHWVG